VRIRLTQLDGRLPNLALMKLAHWHKERGDDLTFTRHAERDMFEPEYDRVYASAIFRYSTPKIARLLEHWPTAVIGGTGTSLGRTVEEFLGEASYEHYDYSPYPSFEPSLGFTQRGCRMRCRFCVVPAKEGRIASVNTIGSIWRGEPHARQLHLLDNDFFGQDEPVWQARIDEIRAGNFRVCFSQGVNVRLITPAAAAALSSIEYRDDGFRERRLYTAWDNLGDERVFFRGIDRLETAGVPPTHVMAYMLVGFDAGETWPRIWHRFNRMVARGIRPYPMVFDVRAVNPALYHNLKRFQRWVVTGMYRAFPFAQYDASRKRNRPAIAGPNANEQLGLIA
jgi:hypothetical protein